MMRRYSAVLLTLALLACSSNDATGFTVTAQGNWRGDKLGETGYIFPQLMLRETRSGYIEGTVNYTDPTRSSPVDLTTDGLRGQQTSTTVSLDWTLKARSWHYDATVTADSLYGTISNGEATFPQTFKRQ